MPVNLMGSIGLSLGEAIAVGEVLMRAPDLGQTERAAIAVLVQRVLAMSVDDRKKAEAVAGMASVYAHLVGMPEKIEALPGPAQSGVLELLLPLLVMFKLVPDRQAEAFDRSCARLAKAQRIAAEDDDPTSRRFASLDLDDRRRR